MAGHTETKAQRRRFRLGSPRAWSTALGALAVLSFAAAIPLTLLANQVFLGVVAAVIGVPCAAVGFAVTRRQPDNPLGWLFLVLAICQFIGTDGGTYALTADRFGHHLPFVPVALALDEVWGPSLELFLVIVLLFPDGRLPSRFWRWVLRVYGILFAAELAVTAVAVAVALAAHPVRVDSSGGLATVDNMTGWLNVVHGLLIKAVFLLSVTFIVRQALSWRRAAGERRQQLKWLASGAVVTIVCLGLGGTFGSGGGGGPKTVLFVIGNFAWFGVAALPVSMGVAILKYRLPGQVRRH